jgi:hypothetical protein
VARAPKLEGGPRRACRTPLPNESQTRFTRAKVTPSENHRKQIPTQASIGEPVSRPFMFHYRRFAPEPCVVVASELRPSAAQVANSVQCGRTRQDIGCRLGVNSEQFSHLGHTPGAKWVQTGCTFVRITSTRSLYFEGANAGLKITRLF